MIKLFSLPYYQFIGPMVNVESLMRRNIKCEDMAQLYGDIFICEEEHLYEFILGHTLITLHQCKVKRS